MFDKACVDYPQAPLSPLQENQRHRLERIKMELMSRVQDIDRAIALLDKNPEIEELTDLLRRI